MKCPHLEPMVRARLEEAERDDDGVTRAWANMSRVDPGDASPRSSERRAGNDEGAR